MAIVAETYFHVNNTYITVRVQNKVTCVFPMVVVSLSSYTEFGQKPSQRYTLPVLIFNNQFISILNSWNSSTWNVHGRRADIVKNETWLVSHPTKYDESIYARNASYSSALFGHKFARFRRESYFQKQFW